MQPGMDMDDLHVVYLASYQWVCGSLKEWAFHTTRPSVLDIN